MTSRHYDGDCCPACGSHQVIPYAVLVGIQRSVRLPVPGLRGHVARPDLSPRDWRRPDRP